MDTDNGGGIRPTVPSSRALHRLLQRVEATMTCPSRPDLRPLPDHCPTKYPTLDEYPWASARPTQCFVPRAYKMHRKIPHSLYIQTRQVGRVGREQPAAATVSRCPTTARPPHGLGEGFTGIAHHDSGATSVATAETSNLNERAARGSSPAPDVAGIRTRDFSLVTGFSQGGCSGY